MLKTVLFVGTGGFFGSIARYYVSKINLHVEFFSIPVGTLLVNVLGSFIIGFLIGVSSKSMLLNANLRMLLMVGFCGGFTTFSTFSGENLALMQSGQILSVLIYTALSVILGFAAVYLGYVLSNLL